MNYLAIDTSGQNLTVVIQNENGEFTYYDVNCGVSHSKALLPETEKLALKANFDFNSADFFAVVTGAGSFTGIRIGVSTVKAFCLAFDKPCLAVTSFDTIAYNVDSGKRLAIIDAGHGGFYVAGYDGEAVSLSPRYLLKEELNKLHGEYEFLSSAPLSCDIPSRVVSVKDGLIKAIAAKRKNATRDLESVTPLYVRKSQAEEGRK